MPYTVVLLKKTLIVRNAVLAIDETAQKIDQLAHWISEVSIKPLDRKAGAMTLIEKLGTRTYPGILTITSDFNRLS